MTTTTEGDTTSRHVEPVLWLDALRDRCRAHAFDYVTERCREHFTGRAEDVLAGTVLPEFAIGGKFLRPLFAYIGWCCDRPESDAALRAATSLELLHCFALAQDDVMDRSALRRGRPALHTRFARWHRQQGWGGSPDRFGDSAAVLFGDLFLVWAEQMLRESGLSPATLARGWPRYDAMRAELAVGQLADLVNDARSLPDWDSVLDVVRRKSGNYTVRRPLEFGAALAGCGGDVLDSLGTYGGLVGEAFQFRDDLLGACGDPAVTGKPAGQDLRDRKATSVVVLARDMATAGHRSQLDELIGLDVIDDDAVARWQALITDTGAPDHLEKLIDERVRAAVEAVDLSGGIPRQVAEALVLLANQCAERDK